MTKKQKAKKERAALDELRAKHSYMLYELRHKDERVTMIYHRDHKTGTSMIEPAVCVKLVVPADSELGKEILANRKAMEKKVAQKVADREAKRAKKVAA